MCDRRRPTDPIERAAAFVAAEVEAVLRAVDDIATAALQAHGRGSRNPAAVADLERVARRHLAQPGSRLWGLGFVGDPAACQDCGGLEWWQRSRRGGSIEPLIVSLDPTAVDFYDYTRAPWFVGARDRGLNITGPYVDATGTNEHIVTFTKAVIADGRFIGVAGADVLVGTFQALLQPFLAAVGEPVSLVDADGQVIATNDPRALAGVIRVSPDTSTYPVSGTPWRFVVGGGSGESQPRRQHSSPQRHRPRANEATVSGAPFGS